MIFILSLILLLLVALVVFLLSADLKDDEKRTAETKKKEKEAKHEQKELDEIKRQCFESYRQMQIAERAYNLYRTAFCDKGIFYYLAEFFAFRSETEEHRLMSHEYKAQLSERVLNPLKAAVNASCPYKNGEYTVPETFDVFLTPDEYYDQQLSYRGVSAIYQSDSEFFRERLEKNMEKQVKMAKDPSNAFFADLWRRIKPLLEKAENEYRSNINEAASREAALLYTKELSENFEEELYRSGIGVMWYFRCTPGERERYFKTDPGRPDVPAIVRESDGICYEKGNHTR